MEDYEEQEIEFWRKLEEEGVSRSAMLKRSIAAAAGLTVFSSAGAALASGRKISSIAAAPPLKGTAANMPALIAAAKKEGHLNVIALPPDWANYGEIISTFSKKYGIPITSDNPDGSSAQENQAIVSLKGDPRAPDVVDVGPSFAVLGTTQGLYGKYFVSSFGTVPRAMKDTRGWWTGDYWGSITIGYNANLVSTPPKSFADLLKPEYKNKVALNGSPLQSNSAVAGVFAAALANGGSLSNVAPGIDWFQKAKQVGNYIPVQTTPQTVASGQTPISIDWDYNNFAYVKEFPAAAWKVNLPTDGQYGGYYCQAINATAPHPNAARLWEEFIYSDQGQLLYMKGYAHPARFADIVARKAIPKALAATFPASWLNAKPKFASLGQITAGKALINQQWPSKVGA
jgi:putative spermidine/putrescine transport system substrate-binding protein